MHPGRTSYKSKIILWASVFLLAVSAVLYGASNSDPSIVDLYGQLRVDGNRIVNESGESIILRGMSLFWSQWEPEFYNEDCIEWLKEDWKCTIVRAAMAVESGGYLQNPETEKNKIYTVVEACIDLGLYVIIDWHDHEAEIHQEEAVAFFSEMAEYYADEPNVIYEIYNEPLQVSWSDVVKPYSEAVIEAIRTYDPDNIIIVGTPSWCQEVTAPVNDPLEYDNIVYALHFYAATHTQWLRNRSVTALSNGLPLFASEFGTCESTGDGDINYTQSEAWFDFMEDNLISWCNWSIADKTETSAALQPGASGTGGWTEEDLKESGAYVRDKIIEGNTPIFTNIDDIGYRPSNVALHQNYPNPFNAETHIEFDLTDPEHVHLEVYNTLGQKVSTLLNQNMAAGHHRIPFYAALLPSGIYLVRLQTESAYRWERMVLLK